MFGDGVDPRVEGIKYIAVLCLYAFAFLKSLSASERAPKMR